MISEADYFTNAGKQKLYSDATNDPVKNNMATPTGPQWTGNGIFRTITPEWQAYNSNERAYADALAAQQGAKNDKNYQLLQQQYKQYTNREQNLAGINQWEQSRNPYYSSLYEGMNKAQEGGIEQSYSDSMKRMQLQHAGRGTMGGSQNAYNSGQIGAAKALQIAQARQQSQNYVQGLRQQDQGRAQQLRLAQYEGNPYADQYAHALAQSNQLQGGMYAPYAQGQIANAQADQQYQNNMSQLYGQQLGLVGQGAQIGMMYI